MRLNRTTTRVHYDPWSTSSLRRPLSPGEGEHDSLQHRHQYLASSCVLKSPESTTNLLETLGQQALPKGSPLRAETDHQPHLGGSSYFKLLVSRGICQFGFMFGGINTKINCYFLFCAKNYILDSGDVINYCYGPTSPGKKCCDTLLGRFGHGSINISQVPPGRSPKSPRCSSSKTHSCTALHLRGTCNLWHRAFDCMRSMSKQKILPDVISDSSLLNLVMLLVQHVGTIVHVQRSITRTKLKKNDIRVQGNRETVAKDHWHWMSLVFPTHG